MSATRASHEPSGGAPARAAPIDVQACEMPADDNGGDARMREQQLCLPPAWQAADAAVVRTTEYALFAVGITFAVMITLEVISRYVFSFSIFVVNAAARLLLVWFFMLGAGVALRHGAHVGFELIVSRLAPARRRVVLLAGYALSLAFFAQMIWSGAYSVRPALGQVEPGLDISLVWVVVAVPVGFALLAYHVVVLIVAELRPANEAESIP
jgi:TRAP-type C4-dicarboxylate transport system permease small subunit